ncbi:MAG: hypothetical protein Q9Q40_03570 [Acidobacteriota bacterium]|nr:hypothetical protein [Acidobacteriota bacterium]
MNGTLGTWLGRPVLWLPAGAAAAAALPFGLGGGGWLTPLAAGSLAFAYLRGHHRDPRGRVIAHLLAWAVTLSAVLIALTIRDPAAAGRLIPHGEAYWAEMAPYVATGMGKEALPELFVPEHVLHLLGFVVLALATAGLGALILGAYLTGYMSFYVGQLAVHASHPWLAATLGWHPWAVLRVVAFVMLGVSLARVLLERPRPLAWWNGERRLLLAAAGLWLFDLLLKTLLAPGWARVLREVAGVSLEG